MGGCSSTIKVEDMEKYKADWYNTNADGKKLYENILVGDVAGIKAFESQTLPYTVYIPSTAGTATCKKHATINAENMVAIKKQLNEKAKFLNYMFDGDVPFPNPDPKPSSGRGSEVGNFGVTGGLVFEGGSSRSSLSEGGSSRSSLSEGGSKDTEDTIVPGVPDNILFIILGFLTLCVLYLIFRPSSKGGRRPVSQTDNNINYGYSY
jgi:hypothetical protein